MRAAWFDAIQLPVCFSHLGTTFTKLDCSPGSSVGSSKDDSIDLIADAINRAHKATSTVITVLENMAGQGSVIGSSFEDLARIIEKVEDKSRVGVCLDTCEFLLHSLSAL